MSISVMTSREFNQDSSGAKKAAEKEPVIITDRGKPTHVLMSYDAYLALQKKQRSIYDAVGDPASAHIDFEPPRMSDKFLKPAEFD
jgi:prevent-host-death family protein